MIIATSTPKKWKIGAELIKWYQRGTQYSHVLIIKDDLVYQASNTNVNCMHIDVFLEDHKIINAYDVGEDMVDFDFVKKQLGKDYGFFQLVKIAVKFLLGIRLRDNGSERFICSEFVGRALMLDWVNDYTEPRHLDVYLRQANNDAQIV